LIIKLFVTHTLIDYSVRKKIDELKIKGTRVKTQMAMTVN
jgi:hypothetical protein